MIQSGPSWAALAQLARAHVVQDKESKLLETIHLLGYSLNVPLQNFPLLAQDREHTCVPMRSLAMRMLQECPRRLLAGHGLDSLEDFQSLLQRFWNCYMVFNGQHPVFTEKTAAELCRCIPIKVHADEGTGLRKTAIYQFSWGPVIPKDLNSCNRYFFWSCIFHEQYKKHHAGFDAGNAVLDDLMQHLTDELNFLYHDGLLVGDAPYFLVLVGLEGDLPAQARAMHCTLTAALLYMLKVSHSRMLFFHVEIFVFNRACAHEAIEISTLFQTLCALGALQMMTNLHTQIGGSKLNGEG